MAEPALKLPQPMTVDEFLAWDSDAADARYDLVDGQPVAKPMRSVAHGGIVANLAYLLGTHLVGTRPVRRVIVGPGVVVRLRARDNVRVADLGVTCAPATRAEPLLEAPVLLVEVLSPSNRRQSWDNARAYATIPSLRDILLVQSTRIEAMLLTRGADGHWPADGETILDPGEVHLESIDYRLPLREAYADTHLV